ncbi:MAG TPA: hypothetical protein VNC22_23385 [Sporichthya sp.]|jgi:hypothetical protein|nr:hypothetical protein [Sporichthya sp.]
MLAELSLGALNALGSIFTFLTVVFVILAIIGVGAFVGGWVEMDDAGYDERSNGYYRGRRLRRSGLVMTFVCVALATASMFFAANFNTTFNVRHDQNVPQRVDRSEVKVDSNAPTGVIVDGR